MIFVGARSSTANILKDQWFLDYCSRKQKPGCSRVFGKKFTRSAFQQVGTRKSSYTRNEPEWCIFRVPRYARRSVWTRVDYHGKSMDYVINFTKLWFDRCYRPALWKTVEILITIETTYVKSLLKFVPCSDTEATWNSSIVHRKWDFRIVLVSWYRSRNRSLRFK